MIRALFQIVAVFGLAILSGCSEEGGREYSGSSINAKSDGPEDKRIRELVSDSVSYMYELSLIRGHLWVAKRLSMANYLDHAVMHAKHPEDEIYSDLVEVFELKGLKGFAAELSTFSNSVVNGDKKAIEENYQALLNSIEASHDLKQLATRELFELVNRLISQAGREYAIGIIDGKVDNVHEYQDALGFIEVAMDLTRNYEQKIDLPDNHLVVIELLKNRLEELLEMWPSLVPLDQVPFDASRLFGAAADVEILGLSL